MQMIEVDFDVWGDIVQSINDSNPRGDNFSHIDYDSDTIYVSHYYHSSGELFSINMYISGGNKYLMNPKFVK